MNIDASYIVLIAGSLSILALLISKISTLCNRPKHGVPFKNSYECGIEKQSDKFVFWPHNIDIIVFALILEHIAFLLAVSCLLDIKDSSWNGYIFIRILIFVFIIGIISVYRFVLKKNA